jgi:formate dehydrogenase iron-sulfur subunit
VNAAASAVRIYVPRDATALALGAEAVAVAISREAVRRGIGVDVVRNGSRGLFWLEPLVEVATPAGRIAYGPVQAADVATLFDAGFVDGGAHALRLGAVEDIAYFKQQDRLTFARVGIVDPASVEDYVAHGGYRGLARALAMASADIVKEVTESGLRGRGGAAFPAGIKWKTVLEAPVADVSRSPRSVDGERAAAKYIVCNADEGDSGTFSDRMLMEGDPFSLIEGMTIAGIAVGATQGYIYLRSEYPHAHRALRVAIAAAYAAGWLGADLNGSGRRFELEVRLGAGAYICGEETSLLDSLEGKRGQVRFKPPLPAIKGLFGKPTVINNVITLASVPTILDKGARFYQEYGVGRSRGTLPIQLAGNLRRTGLVEKAFGVTLRELLYDYGGGSLSGRPIRAVQVGGPLGAYMPESQFDTVLDYEAFAALGAMVGHGGIVAFDDTVDMLEQARYAMEFCAVESCGKCTPCRIGSTRGVEVLDRIRSSKKAGLDEERERNLALLDDLCSTMRHGSLCAMGGLTPDPVVSAIKYFPEDFRLAPSPAGGRGPG